MFAVEIYAAVRRFVFVEGKSRREAARVFGLSRDTISKMCRYWAPPARGRATPSRCSNAVLATARMRPWRPASAPVVHYAPAENLEHVDVALIDAPSMKSIWCYLF